MEEERKIVKISEISALTLWNILDWLESLDEDPETKKESALIKLERFLPNISMNELMVLREICKERDISLYNSFVSKHPDLEFDTSGKSQPVNQEPWRVKLEALNQTYNYSKQSIDQFQTDVLKHKPNQQIVSAKNLKCLKNMKYREYTLVKKLFINKFGDKKLPININDFEYIKHSLSDRVPHIKIVISLILDHCLKYSHVEDFEFFLGHTFARLDVLACDKKLSEPSNKEFLNAINTIISLNN